MEAILPTRSPGLYSPWHDISTISLSSLVLASFWLDDCQKNHRLCTVFQTSAASTRQLPKRIINIADPERPFLASPSDMNLSYVTLSYKWGESRRYVTNLQNLEQHKTKIPLKALPWTFKDAIYVANTLGFSWLWIDALCILQDSKDEQMHEIEKMDLIFRHSALTLFAAAAEHADAGLSVSRDPRWIKPCRLMLKTTLGERTVQGSAYITLDDIDEESCKPLFGRGWVLQEEVMSTRGLIFGPQLSWRCMCAKSSEKIPDIERDKSGDGWNLLRLWIQHQDPVPNRDPWQRGNQFDHWYSMVTKYSRRALTYSSDVLPALAGVASAMATTHNCTYIAGLWQEDLQVGLCWYVTGSSPLDREPLGKRTDPPPGSCPAMPSWSWISQWGKEIRFRGWENNHYLMEQHGIYLVDELSLSKASVAAPFSSVTKTSLVLTGLLRTATVQLDPRRNRWEHDESSRVIRNVREEAHWMCTISDPVSRKEIGQIALDSDPRNVTVGLIHCMLCTVREKYSQWQLTCLALVPTDESYEEFKRVGLVFLREPNWFGHLLFSEPATKTRGTEAIFVRTVRIT
jgi:hypothetical protein